MTLIFDRPRYKNGNLKPAALRMLRHKLIFQRGGALQSALPWFDAEAADLDKARMARDWCELVEGRYVALIQGAAVIDWAGDKMDLADLRDFGVHGFSLRAVEQLLHGGGAT